MVRGTTQTVPIQFPQKRRADNWIGTVESCKLPKKKNQIGLCGFLLIRSFDFLLFERSVYGYNGTSSKRSILYKSTPPPPPKNHLSYLPRI